MKIFALLALCVVCGAEKPHLNAGIEASNSFAFNLYSILAKNNSNVFFSPASVSVTLAKTSLATNGKTSQELSQVMFWVNEEMRNIHTGLQELLETLRSTKKEVTKVRFANRLYADNIVNPADHFTDKLKKYYGVGLGRVNFAGETSQSRRRLNSWIKKKTGSLMKNVIAENGYLSSDTKLVGVSAVHFSGPWLKGFKGKSTIKNGKFKVNKSTVLKKIPVMRLEENLNYGDCKILKANVLEMFYVGRKFSMIIILPKARVPLKVIEDKMNYRTYQDCIASMKETRVKVLLPKFKLRQDTQMKSALKEMGIKSLFDESKAPISGLTGKGNLKVDEIFHQSFISVGEKGNREQDDNDMGKATGKTKSFKADRPFLFFIRENAHGSVLLMGRVNEPLYKLKSKKKDK